jgi:hypothetical protein
MLGKSSYLKICEVHGQEVAVWIIHVMLCYLIQSGKCETSVFVTGSLIFCWGKEWQSYTSTPLLSSWHIAWLIYQKNNFILPYVSGYLWIMKVLIR